MKRWILRSDGILQRYNIKHISNYYKTGDMSGTANVWSKTFEKAMEEVETFHRKIKRAIKKRIRTQLAFNSKYYVSIRAVSLNKSKEELEKALDEYLSSNPKLDAIPFYTEGFEETELDAFEDKNLSESKIQIELNIRGMITTSTI